MKSFKIVMKKWSLCALAGICFAIFSMLPGVAAAAVVLCILGLRSCAKGKKGRVPAVVGLVLSAFQFISCIINGEAIVPGTLQSYVLLCVLALGTYGLSIVFLWVFSAMWNSENVQPIMNRATEKAELTKPAATSQQPPSAALPSARRWLKCGDGKVIYSSDTRALRERQCFDSETKDIPIDIVVSRCLAEFICGLDYEFCGASIGGGADEVSHTGHVAYRARFYTLDDFVYNADEHYRNAAADAAAEYGGWFSALNYSYIVMDFKKPGCRLRVDWSYDIEFIFSYDISFLEAESLCRIHEYLFQPKSSVFADRLSYDSLLHKLRHTLQLDEQGLFFLSTFVTENGELEKTVLDIEDASDRHYEFSAEAAAAFAAALQKELGKKRPALPYLAAAMLADRGEAALEALARGCCSASFHY